MTAAHIFELYLVASVVIVIYDYFEVLYAFKKNHRLLLTYARTHAMHESKLNKSIHDFFYLLEIYYLAVSLI